MKQLLIGLVLLCGAAAAQEASGALTGPAFNGRFWQLLNSNEKGVYVGAFHEGLGLGMTLTAAGPYDPNKLSDQYLAKGAGSSEIVKGLDQFYEDAANARIPIFAAMKWFREKCRGRSPAQLEALIAAYRFNAETFNAERQTGTAAGEKMTTNEMIR